MLYIISDSRFFRALLPSLLIISFMAGASTVRAYGVAENRYMGMSLDQLMKIKITSVSKSEERLSDAAAAIFVITQEDIKRSGATTIPEALRMAPGIQVAHIDANKWAITARGFNGKYANKLLVLLDGRTLYTPFYSGVYWDVQDTMLEDIDRIEVIRGPGATLWGSNAVNGVINIITKSAGDSQGTVVAGGAGNQERGFGQGRFGGQIGNFYYRVYGKGFYRASYPFGSDAYDNSSSPKTGSDANDAWSSARGGFRTDWDISSSDSLTMQGDIYTGYSQEIINFQGLPDVGILYDKANISGGNILGRWNHKFADGIKLTVQMYYDRTERSQYEYNAKQDTYDLDIQQTIPLPWNQHCIVGFEYRYNTDSISTNLTSLVDTDSKKLHWISGFIQDEISIIPHELKFILGSKFESNDYTGFEIQPSARLSWKPTMNQTFWAAISRAVRTPSRADENLDIYPVDIPASGTNPGMRMKLKGSSHFKSEKLLAYEIGYRIHATKKISLDIAAFWNEYDDLRTLEPAGSGFDFTTMQYYKNFVFKNKQSGHTYGLELAGTIKPFSWWTIYTTYSWLHYNISNDSGSDNSLAMPDEFSPDQQFSLRSYVDLPKKIEFDTSLYYSGSVQDYSIPSYTRIDLRLGWKPVNWIDLSLMLQNLLDNQHPEFGGSRDGLVSTEVPRSFYTKITFSF